MKTITKIGIVLLLLAIVGLVTYFTLVFKENQLKEDVRQYLLDDRGYKENDIADIKSRIAKAPVFSVEVIFSDELNVVYYYRDRDGKIIQYGTPTSLDNNVNMESLKHVENE